MSYLQDGAVVLEGIYTGGGGGGVGVEALGGTLGLFFLKCSKCFCKAL